MYPEVYETEVGGEINVEVMGGGSRSLTEPQRSHVKRQNTRVRKRM